MIVLDEQLPTVALSNRLRRWYRGQICVITELRPGSIIKDEAIPELLRRAIRPTFVTLNWSDFWRRTEAHGGFCLVGFTLPSERAEETSLLLRRLFRLPDFRTKAARMGKIARVTEEGVAYYQAHETAVRLLALPD